MAKQSQRKNHEGVLRETIDKGLSNLAFEDSFRLLTDYISDPIVVANEKCVIIEANEAFAKICGLKREELIGKNAEQLACLSEKTKRILCNNLKKRIEGYSIEPYETELLSKNGETKHFELSGKRIEYRGKPADLVILHDVTQRKQLEERMEKTVKEKTLALTANEITFDAVFESSPDAITILDPKGNIAKCNQATADLHNYSSVEEMIGKNAFELISPKDHARAALLLQEMPKVGLKKNLEFTFVTKTGEEFPAEGSAAVIKDCSGVLLGFICVTRNVQKRRETERRVRESEEKYRKLFDESLDAIFVADSETGMLVDCNLSASKLVGREKAELVGQHQSFIHPKEQMEREFTGDFKQHVLDHNKILETQIIRKTSEIRDVSVKATIFELNGKKILQGTFRDITEFKLMQRALQESEEKFRTITNSVKDAIITVDNEAKVVSWNPAAGKTFGYTRIEAIGKNIHELVVPKTISAEGRDYIRIGVKQFANTGSGAFTNGNVELIGRRKDGSEFPAKLSVTPVKLHGKWCAVGVVKDITEGKQAEEKLKEAEKRYHALFNEAPLGVLVIDPQTGKAVEFNDVANDQLGYSREEFSKLRISDYEAQKSKDEIDAEITKILAVGEDEFETKHCCKNGEIRSVIVTIRAVELEGKKFFDCIFHDITEIRKVQDALMESETKYRQLVNVAQEGIWAFDNNYQTIFVNPRLAQMLRRPESELVGKSIFEFLDKKHIEQATNFLGEFKQGFHGHFDYSFARKDGSRIDVSIIASIISDDEGKPVGTLAMLNDITDRKILERKVENYSKHLKSMVDLRTVQLKYANEQLVKSERLAAIGELAGMVGHDLRNPLAGIKNAAYYLKKKGTAISETQYRDMLEIIDKAIGHSDKIINDLLDFAREMKIELTKYKAYALVDEAIRLVMVPDRIQIINDVQHETTVWVNADKIMRVFLNLIKNAIDAMPHNGTLTISSCLTKDRIEISFADTGTGIPDDVLPKLFSPLFTTKAQGMGFGLAICKRFVEAHEGTITIQTELNKGTKFTITLPVEPKAKVEVEGEKTWVNMPESLLLTTTKT